MLIILPAIGDIVENKMEVVPVLWSLHSSWGKIAPKKDQLYSIYMLRRKVGQV